MTDWAAGIDWAAWNAWCEQESDRLLALSEAQERDDAEVCVVCGQPSVSLQYGHWYCATHRQVG